MIRTYQDLVEQLMDEYDLPDSARNLRLCRRAVDDAYTQLPQRARWSYYNRHLSLQTTTPYVTGTIAYDHTGGAYERLVTLTDGTWPEWTKSGRFTVGRLKYEIERRIDDTRITLPEHSNPGADLAAGTAYQLERIQYELPAGFRRLLRCFDTLFQTALWIERVQDVRDSAQILATRSTYPQYVTVTHVESTPDKMCLEFTPPPSSGRNYDLYYEAMPRPLSVWRELAGTIAVTAGSPTVTGTGTAFAQIHVGCVLRIGSAATAAPTNETGYRTDDRSSGSVQEARVLQVDSATSLVLDADVEATATGVAYSISDPLDIEATAMWNALSHMASARLSLSLGRSDQRDREERAIRAIRQAMENDQRIDPNKLTTLGAFNPNLTSVADQ